MVDAQAGVADGPLDAPLPSGTVVAGKYRILSEIGRGGMGTVYLAQHVELEREVAIKILSQRSEHHRQRFVREARAAAKLQTDHVARVSDVGVDEVVGPYLVMERLVGDDLGHILDAQGKMPTEAAVDAVTEAIVAVAEAHALGIVHRDLKPATSSWRRGRGRSASSRCSTSASRS